MCLIVEYARYGNLRDFLRQCEEVVLSLNHKPHIPRTRQVYSSELHYRDTSELAM